MISLAEPFNASNSPLLTCSLWPPHTLCEFVCVYLYKFLSFRFIKYPLWEKLSMADPDAQEEMFHFSRKAFCASWHLPLPCALPVGPNGSKNRSSCLAQNLLTYCVCNKWDRAMISWDYFCCYQILNPALGESFKDDFLTLKIVCVPVCLSVNEKRGTWGETQVSAVHSLC